METNSDHGSPQDEIICDYLVVGAGTTCLAFLDTLLDLREDFTFVIVDRNSTPGGHWTKAYPYVRLHQPSCNYGVRSLPLSKLDKRGKEVHDLSERATGKEICEYYERLVDNFRATGRVQAFFNANYEGLLSGEPEDCFNYDHPTSKFTHKITVQGGKTLHVRCKKVVTCQTDVNVPSMRTAFNFPVDTSVVTRIPLNDLPLQSGQTDKKFIVVGAGKSGVDALMYLLNDLNVPQEQITWIVSRPVWYWMRDVLWPTDRRGRRFWKDITHRFFQPLLDAKSGADAFVQFEKLGVMARVDPDDGCFPTMFKGPTLVRDELSNLRSLQNVVKKGRISSITSKEIIFQDGNYSMPFDASETVFVDCTVDNDYGYFNFEEGFEIFNAHKIRLGPMTSLFNPSHSSTQAAFLEAEFSDNQEADAVKNSFCYFPRGAEIENKCLLSLFLAYFYAQMKTDEQFSKYPPYSMFVLGDRTDLNQPDHHGGLVHVLWALFGPLRMKHKADTLLEKMETGGFEDFPTSPLPGRPGVDPSKFQANKREKTALKAKEKASKSSAKRKGKLKFWVDLLGCKSDSAVKSSMHNFLFRAKTSVTDPVKVS